MGTRQVRRTSHFRLKAKGLDDRTPDMVIETPEGSIVVELKTVRSKAQADAAIDQLLGRMGGRKS